jgi:SAM-dependent methyltransferase
LSVERSRPPSSAVYDSLAPRYAAAHHRRFYARVVDELVGCGDQALRGRGLDLACGVGASTASLRRAFPAIEWVGLDRSSPMLAALRSRPELARLPVVRAAAESLPFADASLQVVACSFALHWMEVTAMQEIARVLSPGGRLLLAAPLRTPAPPLPGNRLLARALIADRRLSGGRARAGFTVAEILTALAGWRVHSLRAVTFTEQYRSPDALVGSLSARGALAALFGARAGEIALRLRAQAAARAPIRFGWPAALVAASPEGALRSSPSAHPLAAHIASATSS